MEDTAKEKHEKEIVDLIEEAIKNPEIPNFYANAFVLASGTGDITLFFQRNGVPVATLNLSYTVAKTLALLLGNSITDLERTSGNAIMTTHEVETFRKRSNEKDGV